MPSYGACHGAWNPQELKLDEAKTEVLRRQRQLEKDASTLALGANAQLDRANRKNFDANDMERHVCGPFAEPRGQGPGPGPPQLEAQHRRPDASRGQLRKSRGVA